MDFLVSGVAARIVFIQGNEVHFAEADQPDRRIRSSVAELPYLLADAPDVIELKNSDEEKAFACLLRSWQHDRALRMFQILIDRDEDTEIRQEAATHLCSLLSHSDIQETCENWTYALPLDEPIDIVEANSIFSRQPPIVKFLEQTQEAQEKIRYFRTAWESVSNNHFASMADRAAFELAAIKCGAFRMLARAGNDERAINAAIFECYFRLASQPGARLIVAEWTRDVASQKARKELKKAEKAIQSEAEYDEDYSAIEEKRSPYQNRQNYEAAIKQQEGVKQQLERGSFNLARKFAAELIEFQLEHGGPKFATMSLCSLAQEAKRHGQYSLQLEWIKRATEIAPDDSWAHGLAGDAFLSSFHLDEAQREFQLAGENGDRQFAATGLARVLRISGRLDEALAAFDSAIKNFPTHPNAYYAWAGYAEVLRDMSRLDEALSAYEDAAEQSPNEVIRCGRAAVLKDMGRLNDAQSAYLNIIADFPDCAVAYAGRADVLKTMGELEAALIAYEEAIRRFPTEAVPMCGKADVLQAMGDFEKSLQTYYDARQRFPFEPAAFSGYAEALKDSGHINEALEAYDDAIARFGHDVRLRNGRASVLKIAGRFKDALQAYERNVSDFPYDLYCLSGRADLLKELGLYEDAIRAYDIVIQRRPAHAHARYAKAAVLALLRRFEEAEELLPESEPKTAAEWVAYHIRGMIFLKKGLTLDALRVFVHGAAANPFFRGRKYFETALAATRIRLRNFDDAAKIAQRGTGPIVWLLQLHAFAELGQQDKAFAAFRALNDNNPYPILALRDELASRYKLIQFAPKFDEKWIVEQETDVLLQAA